MSRIKSLDKRHVTIQSALVIKTQTINEILRERRAMTSLMALRLARLFGNTPELWLNAQCAYDLWQAAQANGQEINKIKPLRAA